MSLSRRGVELRLALLFVLVLVPWCLADGDPDFDALFASGGIPPRSQAKDAGAETSVAPSWQTTGDDLLHLSADYVEYDRKSGRVVLKGSAFANKGDLRLWAKALEVSIETGAIYATEEVRFQRPEDDLEGETLSYNTKLRTGTMHGLRTWRGPNLLVADKLEIYPYKMVGHDLYTTACDHDPPHYKVHAKKGTLVPNKHMILERAQLVAGTKKILGFPRYKVNLREGQGNSNFYIRPGYSTSRGFTVDTGYDFYFSDSEFGRVVLNSTSQAGGNGGVAFRYGHGKPSGGDIRAFQNVIRIPGGGNTSSFLDQKSESYSWSHRQALSTRTQFANQLTATKVDVGTLGENRELNWSTQLHHSIPNYNLSLTQQQRIDSDGSSFTQDDLIPELNIKPRFQITRTRPLELGNDFALRLDGAWAMIEERLSGSPTKQEVAKTEINLALTGPAIRAGSTTFTWNLEERLNWYSGTSDRNYMGLSVNGTTPLTNGFEMAYNYVLQRVNGVSPFSTYDVLTDQNLASFFLRQRVHTGFHATWLQMTQDLDRGEFRSASSNFFYRRPQGVRTPWSLGLNLGWGFRNAKSLTDIFLQTISTNLRVARGKWAHQFITNFDAQKGQLASFSTGSDLRLGELWRLQFSTNYGRGANGSLERTRLALALTRDLHAWEARLRWDVEQKEAFLEFYLKHSAKTKLALRADYDAGLGLRPQIGDRRSRPGPILDAIPRP